MLGGVAFLHGEGLKIVLTITNGGTVGAIPTSSSGPTSRSARASSPSRMRSAR